MRVPQKGKRQCSTPASRPFAPARPCWKWDCSSLLIGDNFCERPLGATNNIFMIEWNIQSRSHACQACGQRFADKQPCHTILFDGKTGYERMDVCESCWTAQYSQGATSRKGFISHWQGVFETPPARPEPIQKENAESLLRKLVALNDPKCGAACFILAVMLERKRILKVKEQVQREAKRLFIYEHPGTGDVFTVTDPNLRLDQLDEVQRDVAQLLEHGLPAPAETESSAGSPGAGSEAIPPDRAASGPSAKLNGQPMVC